MNIRKSIQSKLIIYILLACCTLCIIDNNVFYQIPLQKFEIRMLPVYQTSNEIPGFNFSFFQATIDDDNENENDNHIKKNKSFVLQIFSPEINSLEKIIFFSKSSTNCFFFNRIDYLKALRL